MESVEGGVARAPRSGGQDDERFNKDSPDVGTSTLSLGKCKQIFKTFTMGFQFWQTNPNKNDAKKILFAQFK